MKNFPESGLCAVITGTVTHTTTEGTKVFTIKIEKEVKAGSKGTLKQHSLAMAQKTAVSHRNPLDQTCSNLSCFLWTHLLITLQTSFSLHSPAPGNVFRAYLCTKMRKSSGNPPVCNSAFSSGLFKHTPIAWVCLGWTDPLPEAQEGSVLPLSWFWNRVNCLLSCLCCGLDS